MPTKVTPARIVCLEFNLQQIKMQMGVQVSDQSVLEKISQRYLHFSVFRFIITHHYLSRFSSPGLDIHAFR
jgi:hypothetical protein